MGTYGISGPYKPAVEIFHVVLGHLVRGASEVILEGWQDLLHPEGGWGWGRALPLSAFWEGSFSL